MRLLSTPPLVLIVEDEEPISLALSLIVEDAGYRAVTAAHGRQALELARQRRPDLIITDYMMPYLNGVALMQAVRAEAQAHGQSAPPIIMMSAIDKPICKTWARMLRSANLSISTRSRRCCIASWANGVALNARLVDKFGSQEFPRDIDHAHIF
jgi:CheY-like chemotaxis protein